MAPETCGQGFSNGPSTMKEDASDRLLQAKRRVQAFESL